MNKIILTNFCLLLLLSLYILVADLGFLGASFVYSPNTYTPWTSHFWPRANYEVLDEAIILHQSTWLDLNLPVMFQSARLQMSGEGLENLTFAWKESVEGEILLLSPPPTNGVVQVDLSAIPEPRYLVFSLEDGQSARLNRLKISFEKPRWFYDFKKNVLK